MINHTREASTWVQRRRLSNRAVVSVVLYLALGSSLSMTALAQVAPRGTSAACTAAKQRVASDNLMIARLRAQLANPNVTIQKVRAAQIRTRLAQLQADLVKARAAQTAACGPSVRDYAGSYSAMFGRIVIHFIVVGNGVVSGDIVSVVGRTIDARTGVVDAQANFLGADCGFFKVFFNAKAGTATAHLSCTLSGLSQSGTVVAHRK